MKLKLFHVAVLFTIFILLCGAVISTARPNPRSVWVATFKLILVANMTFYFLHRRDQQQQKE
jgi:hypothetical protein